MYQGATADGECPLVIDTTTPSCGSSRFGCWTCTVVQRDRSMEAMIENGQTWMQPMLDFRDWLSSTQDPAKKKNIREHRRRTGRIQYGEKDGKKKIIWGPYKLKVRQDILKRLLKAQTEVQKNGPDPNMELIQKQELHKIRQLWIHEEGDWEDSLPGIYQEVIGDSLDWIVDDASGLGGEEKKLISDVCNKHELNPILLMELFDVEQAHQGMAKRRGVYDKIGSILNKDWRSREEALAELENAEQENEVEAA